MSLFPWYKCARWFFSSPNFVNSKVPSPCFGEGQIFVRRENYTYFTIYTTWSNKKVFRCGHDYQIENLADNFCWDFWLSQTNFVSLGVLAPIEHILTRILACEHLQKFYEHTSKRTPVNFLRAIRAKAKFWAYGIPRNEAKRSQTKRNELKRNETKRNETKRNETKQNKTKGNLLHIQEWRCRALTIVVLARSPVSKNTNSGRLVIDETRLVNYFYWRSLFVNFLVR